MLALFHFGSNYLRYRAGGGGLDLTLAQQNVH